MLLKISRIWIYNRLIMRRLMQRRFVLPEWGALNVLASLDFGLMEASTYFLTL